MAVLLAPDFDDEGEAGVDEAAVYTRVAYEAQLARETMAISRSKPNKPIQKKRT